MPAWGFLLLIVAGTTFITSWVCYFVARPDLETLTSLHWTEKARILFPMYSINLISWIFVPIWAVFGSRSFPAGFQDLGIVAIVLVTLVMSSPVALRIERELFGRMLTFRQWMDEWAITFFLLAPALLVGLVATFFFHRNPLGTYLVGTCVLLFFNFRGSVDLLRLFGILRSPDERLIRLVSNVSTKTGIEVKSVWILRWRRINAFALPFANTLGITEALLEKFTDDEVENVITHEVSHLNEPVHVRVLRLLRENMFFCLFSMGVVSRVFGLPGVFFFVFAFAFMGGHVGQVCRLMETRADELGKKFEKNSGDFARAIEKIYELNLMPVSMKQKSTHPDLYDRMLATGITPSYARPGPPENKRVTRAMFVAAFMLFVSLTLFWNNFAPKRNAVAQNPAPSETVVGRE
jgi:Zn-dependent protease with chaperone function